MSDKFTLIVPSIRIFNVWKDYLQNFKNYGHSLDSTDILIIDEGDEVIRKKNKELFPDSNFEFFGPQERETFFKDNLGNNWQKYSTVIPVKNHAETSFGMLVGLERKTKLLCMIDDDTRANEEFDFIGTHLKKIGSEAKDALSSNSKWYNTLDNLILTENQRIYPRGFPFNRRFINEKYSLKTTKGKIVLNQGLWLNVPDMDAAGILKQATVGFLTSGGVGIIEKSCLEGLPVIRSIQLKENNIVLDKGTFTTICSMNVSFSSKIIPAFYQLPMGYMGIGRFDDIWSGIFVKKVCDAMGDLISLGAPCVIHDKEKRDTFKDLKLELEGIMINEKLWQIVDGVEIDTSDYITAYRSLVEGIRKELNVFDQRFKEYLDYVTKQMYLWIEICEKFE